MKIYDISQTLQEGITVWPGDQQFYRNWTMQIRTGDSCNVSWVTMSTHTGTHLDAPFHLDDSGLDIASVSLEQYLGPARVVSMEVERVIAVPDLERLNWEGVERLIFKTCAGGLAEDDFDPGFVYLSKDGAEFLGKRGLRLIGTDAPSIDAFESKTLLSHKILLKHNVAILEGARLAAVQPGDYELICLPLRFAGLDGSPVRAILREL